MPDWNEDWPDSTNLRGRRAAFVEAEMAKLQKPIDPLSEDFQQRMRDGLASANAYCMARDPRTLAQRLGYARWTVGDDGQA